MPVLRARVTGVPGATRRSTASRACRARQGIGREFVITYREHLEANETLVEGAMWAAPVDGMAEVSIEEALRRNAGLQMGDIVRFDVLGRVIEAGSRRVRDVDWNESRPAASCSSSGPACSRRRRTGSWASLRAPETRCTGAAAA